MTSSIAHGGLRQFEGFLVYVLRTAAVEIAVVPELGAKIISLKNLRTQREWLWRPKDKLELFKNSPRDDFSASTLVGIDECLQRCGVIAGGASTGWQLSVPMNKP